MTKNSFAKKMTTPKNEKDSFDSTLIYKRNKSGPKTALWNPKVNFIAFLQAIHIESCWADKCLFKIKVFPLLKFTQVSSA